jgi:hypothetical protein
MVLVVHLLLPLLSGGRSNHHQERQRQAVAGNERLRAAFDDWQRKRQATRALTIHDSVRLQKQGYDNENGWQTTTNNQQPTINGHGTGGRRLATRASGGSAATKG